MSRKSRKNNYNSFKITEKNVNKFREASFTAGKEPLKKRMSQYVSLSKHG